MDVLTTILIIVCVTLAICCINLNSRLDNEKKRRERAEKETDSLYSELRDERTLRRETQEMICQGVETITTKLDEMADGGMSPEMRRSVTEGLENLMGYSVMDAMRAVGFTGSDGT